MDITVLKELKRQRGFTNADVARLSKIPLGTINKIFSGTTKVSLKNYYVLLTILSSPYSEIGKNYGYVGCALPNVQIKLGAVTLNAEQIIRKVNLCATKGASVIAFNELTLTGASVGDLVYNNGIFSSIEKAFTKIRVETANLNALIFIGAPLVVNQQYYSCAVALFNGEIVGITPNQKVETQTIDFLGKKVPFGNNIYSCKNNLKVACIVGDEYQSIQNTIEYTQSGANLIVHLSSNKELIGLEQVRLDFIKSASRIGKCGYIFNCTGDGESTTDNVFSGQKVIAENGKILHKTKLFRDLNAFCDIDLNFLIADRIKSNFKVVPKLNQIEVDFNFNGELSFREFSKTPFIPTNRLVARERFEQILTMQALGLKKRVEHTNSKKVVIGISGGLDSALALLVAVRCFKIMEKNLKDILCITMPCFGTSSRTYNNAYGLCNGLGVELQEIVIGNSVKSHFKDIGHDGETTDITFENAQARERTQVLMDMANKVGGLVVGTGDLSELALGWATYNGDHMSNYGVNGSIPKTLVRALCEYEANRYGGAVKEHLIDIIGTPVSPELKPTNQGEIAQKTEDLVGPYILHDFYLYYFLRKGYSPSQIFYLACKVFKEDYSKETIYRWLYTFIKRFISMQFKRSCLPDGVAVGSVGVSPRGGLNMPSDMLNSDFVADLESVKP